MPQITSHVLALLLLLSLCFNLASCIESEAQALLAWRSSLTQSGNLSKWWSYNVSTDLSRWFGIKGNDAGSITSIIYNGYHNGPVDGTLAKFNFSWLGTS
jgi:Leucine rich repeat N-terminal domain